MQVLYFMLFMMALIAYVVLDRDPAEERAMLDRDVVAAHMEAWHHAAIQACEATACAGVVDAKPYLSPSVLAGNAFAVSRFTTRYDASGKMLVTYVNSTTPGKTGVSYEAVLAGLNKDLDGDSSMVGVFDRSTGRINFTSLQGVYKTTYVDAPASMTASLVDGSPVLITKM
jgi:hypothetical protein